MSGLSEALNTSGLDINDVAFWDRVAAHFRDKLGRMVSFFPLPIVIGDHV